MKQLKQRTFPSFYRLVTKNSTILKFLFIALVFINMVFVPFLLQGKVDEHSFRADPFSSGHILISGPENFISTSFNSSSNKNDIFSIKQYLIPSSAETPDFSVIVPLCGDTKTAHQVLASLLSEQEQAGGRKLKNEFIFVDGGTNDDLKASMYQVQLKLTSESNDVFVVEATDAEDCERVVSTGLRFASGRFTLMLQPDQLLAPHALSATARIFDSDPAIGTVGVVSRNTQLRLEQVNRDRLAAEQPLFHPHQVARLARRIMRDRVLSDVNIFVQRDSLAIRSSLLARTLVDEFPSSLEETKDFLKTAKQLGYLNAVDLGGYAHRVMLEEEDPESLPDVQSQVELSSGERRRQHLQTIRSELPRAMRKLDLVLSFAMLTIDPDTYFEAPLPSILFILPVNRLGGGVISVVTDCLVLNFLGHYCAMAIPEAITPIIKEGYLDGLDFPVSEGILMPYHDIEDIETASSAFDVVIATTCRSVENLQSAAEQACGIVPGYYVQDYEPYFFPREHPSYQAALDSYSLVKGSTLFAKTDWMKGFVEFNHPDVHVDRIEPSLDPMIYRKGRNFQEWVEGEQEKAGGRHPLFKKEGDTIVISAMVRFSTERRKPHGTLEILKQVAKKNPDIDIEFRLFGTKQEDFERLTVDLALPPNTHNYGSVAKDQIIDILEQSDLFVDFSQWQAFGRTGLEAMLFGTVPVLPKFGGVDVYAVHGESALVLDSSSISEYVDEISSLVQDIDRMNAMKAKGMERAREFPPHVSGASISALFSQAKVDAWRKKHAHDCYIV